MTKTNNNLKMSLLDNGAHSLKRGYEVWQIGKKNCDGWLLKESIIWIHHGIELLLKQLLVQTNEFLVFQDVNKAVERLGILRRKPGFDNAGVLELFDHDEKVTSIGFMSLIDRVSITLSISELNPGSELRKQLDELTKFRNKIVHFSIELNINAVTGLIGNILEPLLALLSRKINCENFKTVTIPEIRRAAKSVREYLQGVHTTIAEKAVAATIKATSSNTNAGIVSQATGTGLSLSLISYIEKIQHVDSFQNKKIFILTRYLAKIGQLKNSVVDNLYTSSDYHESKVSKLKSNITISTIYDVTKEPFTDSCLLIGYDIGANIETLYAIYPNSTRILFTSAPLTGRIHDFGEIIATYSIDDAINSKMLFE
ncbi:hypothetical protein [Aeromonas veronii]|uniref:hypothetical protein n=1 Tax=Aeromonas veronii TaxID=654 RepID=UPI0031FDB406